MAAEASLPLPSSKKKKPRTKNLPVNPDSEKFDALTWNDSLTNDDPFSLLVGTNEGGFLSLEEIDESEYGLLPGFANSGEEALSNFSKPKKRKHWDGGGGSDNDSCVIEASSVETTEERKGKKKKKKKAKKKKNGETVKEQIDEVGPMHTPCVSTDGREDKAAGVSSEKVIPDEDEFYAWKELRLHPLLMQSIYRLGFKEPTPIQKACIPAAAHQGKDVIGAAETGSGKTLAFGLPILQRLLEEREKAARLLGNEGDAVTKGVQGNPLRALIVTPTRELALQVSDHLKEAAKLTNVNVVPIVGGMSTEKQERLLKRRPEIIVGTPGRLWELMSRGGQHLAELHALSFFVLDEADRMIESGHFHELQSIIDRLPNTAVSVEGHPQTTQACETVLNVRHKKRQTFVFSATVALSAGFRKKLKRGSLAPKASMNDSMSSIETLSERAGMRADAAIVDLTNASIMADKLEESFIEIHDKNCGGSCQSGASSSPSICTWTSSESTKLAHALFRCKEEDKEAYLYYLLSVHGHGQTIVFCTSIAALRRVSSLLRVLGINVWTLHAQMQQRARLKAIDRFRGSEHGVLVATDVAARGLDIPGVRTVVHYQLPHSAEVYVHRSGRTARASSDGCCIAIISPSDRSKFASLCKSFSKESLKRFPIDNSYMSEVLKRLSLARQIENISRNNSQEKAKKNWFKRNAESVELVVEDSGSEEERVKSSKQKKISCLHLKKLQEELNILLTRPLQPKTFSHRYLAGAGISTLLQGQLEELGRQKLADSNNSSIKSKKAKLVVIGRDCIEPLQALRSAGNEVCMDLKHEAERQKTLETRRRKRREEKKRLREQRRKEKKHRKEGGK